MPPTTLQPPASPRPQTVPPPQPPAAQATPPSPPPQQQPVNAAEVYAEICTQIVREQTLIIGALAVEQAGHAEGLMIDQQTLECHITGNGAQVVDNLINKYRDFFGNAAVEVCKEAASRFTTRLPLEQLPASLR